MVKNARVVIWGVGSFFDRIKPLIDIEEERHSINIVAYVDQHVNRKDGHFVVKPKRLNEISFDYIILASGTFYHDMYTQCIEYGIEKSKIIKGAIFLEVGFDLEQYINNGWQQNDIVSDYFSEQTYADYDREYHGREITLYLGRKSFVGGVQFDYHGIPTKTLIKIGNYTSISSEIIFEMEMNLDHAYDRVTTYGLSHFTILEKEMMECLMLREAQINIGSDVWIGKRCIIKSGISIGDGAVIASNSYVVSDVEDYAIYGGNPARFIKYRFSEETRKKLKKSEWWIFSEDKLMEYREYLEDPEQFVIHLLGEQEKC